MIHVSSFSQDTVAANASILIHDSPVMDAELSKSIRAIQDLDFSSIIDTLTIQDAWWRSDAEYVCQQYKNFLILLKKTGRRLVPSLEIDAFWHYHILDTRRYAQDCDSIFGRYIHHTPTYPREFKSSNHKTDFNETQELYKQEFGDYIYSPILFNTKRILKKLLPR